MVSPATIVAAGAAVAKAEIDAWEVREAGTNRVLGVYSTAARPVRGDSIESDGQPFTVMQVADIAVSRGESQRGWLVVAAVTK